MANHPRTRKRVRALPRAPDGSAFKKCDECGETVAVALADMHQCAPQVGEKKRPKSPCDTALQSLKKRKPCFDEQPRSAFRFFMEAFEKTRENEDWIETDRNGLETWKNMSSAERKIYVCQAQKVNSAYEEALLKELDDISEVDEEADSAQVGKFDEFYEDYGDFEMSGGSESFYFESFDTYDWKIKV